MIVVRLRAQGFGDGIWALRPIDWSSLRSVVQVSEGVVDNQIWGGVSSCNPCLLWVNSGVFLMGDFVALALLLIRGIVDVVFLVDVVTRPSTLNFLMLSSSLNQLQSVANLAC